MPPLVILTVIWVAHPVGTAVVRARGWSGAYDLGLFLPALLGVLATWTICRRRAAGRWWATALALVSILVFTWMWMQGETIGPGVFVWVIATPFVVLYTVHVRHRTWFDGRRRQPETGDELPAVFD
jgi:hypothetical protein